ncbi:hypothetical protein XENTR_v10019781 [Xenopus tropicalis]|nr:hypothetical protein XENTR_v10019781 [Xenopus tropicalis]
MKQRQKQPVVLTIIHSPSVSCLWAEPFLLFFPHPTLLSALFPACGLNPSCCSSHIRLSYLLYFLLVG